MKILDLNKLRPKKMIVFDLDGTVVPSKAPMDPQMSALITQLLVVKKIAIIGGGKFGFLKILFLRELKAPKPLLKNLFLFPNT